MALPFHQLFTAATLEACALAGPTLTWTDRSSTAWAWDSAGVLQSFAVGDPRIGAHYYDGAAWVNGGYLVEEQRTNSLLQSRDYDTTWVASGQLPTLTQNQTGADGAANKAWTVEDDDGAVTEGLRQNVTVSDDANIHCVSWRVDKDATTDRFPEFRLILTGGTAQEINIQLNTSDGTTSVRASTGTVTSGVIDEGDWWRLWVTVKNNSTANVTARIEIFPAFASTLGGAEATSETGSIVLDHSQLELAKTFPTSTIPTTTVAVVRGADILSTTDLTWIDATKGTFVATWWLHFLATTNQYVFNTQSEAQASDNPQISQFLRQSSDGIRYTLPPSSGNSGIVTLSNSQMAETQQILAGAYAQDDVAVSLDGAAVATDATFDVTTGYDEFHIGHNDGAQRLNGFIREIGYYDERKTDAELVVLSTKGIPVAGVLRHPSMTGGMQPMQGGMQ